MLRENVMRQINGLLDGHCADCPMLKELNKRFGKSTSHIDKHCHHQCEVGRQLRSLGQQLDCSVRPRVKVLEAEAV